MNVPEEFGDTQLFLKNQYSTGIFLVSPSSCQTYFPFAIRPMKAMQEIFLKIFLISPALNCIFFSDPHVVNDEEDTLLSSIPHDRRENNYLASTSVQILFPLGTVLGEETAGSLHCGFALAFDRHANSFATILTHIYRAELLEFLAHCSNSTQTCLIHNKFWPRSEYCLCSQTKFWSQLRIYHASNKFQLPKRVQSLVFPRI